MKSIAQSINGLLRATILVFAVVMLFMNFQNATSKTMEDTCPTAAFLVENNNCEINSAVIFNNKSTGGITYRWEFGDGNTSNVANPTHIYGLAGTYQVKLTVFRATCTKEFIGTVDVISG